MNIKDKNQLAKLLKRIASYKPKERPKQPKNPPPKSELLKKWRIDNRK